MPASDSTKKAQSTLPSIDAEHLERLWNNVYSKTTKVGIWDVEPDSYLLEFFHEHTLAANSRVLDLGCGDGRNLVWLAEQGYRSFGVDISSVALERTTAAAEAADVDVFTTKALLERLPFDDSTFDFVFASQVFDHVHDPTCVLAEATRVLTNGGWFLCQLSTTKDDALTLGEQLGPKLRCHDGVIFRFFDKNDATQLFDQFDIARVREVSMSDPAHEGWRDEPHDHSYWIVTAQKGG